MSLNPQINTKARIRYARGSFVPAAILAVSAVKINPPPQAISATSFLFFMTARINQLTAYKKITRDWRRSTFGIFLNYYGLNYEAKFMVTYYPNFMQVAFA